MQENTSFTRQIQANNEIRLANRPRAWRVSAFASAFALALVAVYFVAALYISTQRLFWYDEIITCKLSTLPSVRTVFMALLHSADTMTPLYLLTERLFLKMIPHAEIASRLPSALALSAGYLIVFDIGRRLTNSIGGLLALAILLNSLLPPYAFEARAYGFYFLASSLALWIWLFARPRFSVSLFALCFFAGEMLHYYFAFCIVPYAGYELFEMVRNKRLSKPRPKLIGGFIGIASAALLLFPFLNAVRQLSKGFWAVPSVGTLIQIYPDLFPDAALLVALWFLCLLFSAREKGPMRSSEASASERLSWFFLLIPFVGFLLAKLVTNAFYPRYFIGLLPGVAVAVACLSYRLLAPKTFAFAGLAFMFILAGVLTQLRNIKHPEFIDPVGQRAKTQAVLKVERSLFQDGKRYMVPSDPLLFTELAYYSTKPSSVTLFADLNTSPVKRFESHLATILDPFWAQTLWTLGDLEKHAEESALINPDEDLTRVLLSRGYHLNLRYAEPVQVVYLTR